MVVSNDILTLNRLIGDVNDTVKLYRQASEATASQEVIMADISGHLEAVVKSMQAEVLRLGGTPSTTGEHFDAPVSLPPNRTDSVEHHPAILELVEQRERELQADFELALADTSLSPRTLGVLKEACSSLRVDRRLAQLLNRGQPDRATPQGLV